MFSELYLFIFQINTIGYVFWGDREERKPGAEAGLFCFSGQII